MSSHGSTSLAGSLAPSAWQREIARNTAWVHALRSTFLWMRAFIVPQPMLNNEPLLGQSLALLTTAIAQPTQNSPEALRPTRVKPARVQGSTNHELFLPGNNMTRSRGSKADHVAQQLTATPTLPHVTSETPSSSRKRTWQRQAATIAHAKANWLEQVDQRVDDLRLHQWASTRASVLNDARTVNSPSAHGTPIGVNVTHAQGTLGGYPGRGAGDEAQSLHHSLIEQTRRMLQHTYQPLSIDTAYQPPVGHVEQEELLLARQWATTIGDQIAPLELLQHYAALSRQDGVAVTRNGQNNANALSSLPENGVSAKVNTVGTNSNHEEGQQLDNRDILALLAGVGNANNSRNQQISLIQDVEQQSIEREQRTADFVEHILPPQVAAQLPSLITSQRIDMPPLPVAAATARFGARAEMMIDEDLDVLAAKIKRILDDEARRHGIDV